MLASFSCSLAAMCTSEIQMILKCNVEKHFKYAPTSTTSKFLINLTLKMCVNVIESQASKQTLISLFIIHSRHLARGYYRIWDCFHLRLPRKKGFEFLPCLSTSSFSWKNWSVIEVSETFLNRMRKGNILNNLSGRLRVKYSTNFTHFRLWIERFQHNLVVTMCYSDVKQDRCYNMYGE